MKFYMQSLLGQLEQIKKSITPELQQNQTLLLHLYSAEHSIYEIALPICPSPPGLPDYKRTEALLECMTATKKWFEQAFQIPPVMYIGENSQRQMTSPKTMRYFLFFRHSSVANDPLSQKCLPQKQQFLNSPRNHTWESELYSTPYDMLSFH